MRITVVGCGYLGTTHAGCLASLGFDVRGVEASAERLEALRAGRVPFYEPGLPELIGEQVSAGRLSFTDSAADGAAFGDVVFLCVGTPQQAGSSAADTSQLDAALAAMAPYLRPGTLVVGKSTVPVGTSDRLRGLLPEGVELAWNPEFLREGHAVADTLRPDRLVLGVTSPAAETLLRQVYADAIAAGCPVLVTDPRTAELAKSAANAFLATKISFANAIADMCERAEADVTDLMTALGHDSRIGPAFLGAGLGFGGGCLPKDLRSLADQAVGLGVEHAAALLDRVDLLNTERRRTTADRVLGLVGGSAEEGADEPVVTVLGAAFKPGSDDVRDSPGLAIARLLAADGVTVRVHDPQALASARRIAPEVDFADTALAACAGADLVLLATEWPQYVGADPDLLGGVMRRRVVLDGRNVLDRDRWRAAGWTYHGMGRR